MRGKRRSSSARRGAASSSTVSVGDEIPGAWRSRDSAGLVSTLQQINKLMLGQDLDASQFEESSSSSSDSDGAYAQGEAPELWRRSRFGSGANATRGAATAAAVRKRKPLRAPRGSHDGVAIGISFDGIDARPLRGHHGDAAPRVTTQRDGERERGRGAHSASKAARSGRTPRHRLALESAQLCDDVQLGGERLTTARHARDAKAAAAERADGTFSRGTALARSVSVNPALWRRLPAASAAAAAAEDRRPDDARALQDADADADSDAAAAAAALSSLNQRQRSGGQRIEGRSRDSTARRVAARVVRVVSDAAVLCARHAAAAAAAAAFVASEAVTDAAAANALTFAAADGAFAAAAAAAEAATRACKSTDDVLAWCLPVASPGKDARAATAAAAAAVAESATSRGSAPLFRPAWCCPTCTFENPPSTVESRHDRAVCAVCSRTTHVEVRQDGAGGGAGSAAAARAVAAEAAEAARAEAAAATVAAAEDVVSKEAQRSAAAAAAELRMARRKAIACAAGAAADARRAASLASQAALQAIERARTQAAEDAALRASGAAVSMQTLWRRRTACVRTHSLRQDRAAARSATQRRQACRIMQRMWRAAVLRAERAIDRAVDDAIAAAAIELAEELTQPLPPSPVAASQQQQQQHQVPLPGGVDIETVATPPRQRSAERHAAAPHIGGSGVAAARTLRSARQPPSVASAVGAALDSMLAESAAAVDLGTGNSMGGLLPPASVAASWRGMTDAKPAVASSAKLKVHIFSTELSQPPPPKVTTLQVAAPAALAGIGSASAVRRIMRRCCLNCGSHEKKGWYCKTCGRKLILRADGASAASLARMGAAPRQQPHVATGLMSLVPVRKRRASK